jgi:hypothetical protein
MARSERNVTVASLQFRCTDDEDANVQIAERFVFSFRLSLTHAQIRTSSLYPCLQWFETIFPRFVTVRLLREAHGKGAQIALIQVCIYESLLFIVVTASLIEFFIHLRHRVSLKKQMDGLRIARLRGRRA